MNKYRTAIIFYLVAAAIIFILNWVSPGQPDGGPGLGSMAILLLVIVSLALTFSNFFKGLKNKEYFLLAAIHLLIALIVVYYLFL